MKKEEQMLDKQSIDQQLSEYFKEPEAFEKRIRLLKKIQALAVWMDENAENLEKDGENTFQKFKYVKGAQYRTLLRKGCIACGLIFKQNDSTVSPQEQRDGANTVMVMHSLQFLIDPETGEFEQYVTAAVGQDGTDKHLEKAKTQGIKSFVKTNFLISDGDADDNESDAAYASAKGNASKKKEEPKPAVEQEKLDELKALIVAAREKLDDPNYASMTMDKIDKGTLTLSEYNTVKYKASKV